MRGQISRERLNQLAAVSLFSRLSERELADVDKLVDDIEVDAGEVLAREGRLGLESFIVLSGRAAVTIDGEQVAELGPGEIFGEMAILGTVHTRAATVTAITPMRLLVIVPRNLAALLEIGGIASHVISALVDRLRQQVAARPA